MHIPDFKNVSKVLITEAEIAKKVAEIGAAIARDYQGKNVLFVSVLKGSVVFMADLMRATPIPITIDFMAVSSYGAGVNSSGVVKIIKDLDTPLENFDVILVEDILDSGSTLHYLRSILESRRPKSIRIVTLLDKPERRVADIKPNYCGFQIPDAFVVGYGLDYAEQYRNLPYIGVLDPAAYAETD